MGACQRGDRGPALHELLDLAVGNLPPAACCLLEERQRQSESCWRVSFIREIGSARNQAAVLEYPLRTGSCTGPEYGCSLSGWWGIS